MLSGPAYARRWVQRALAQGAEVRTRSMVTGWVEPGCAEVTCPGGLLRVEARAMVLATGARERPRSARLVPGARPAGIFTTGQLQQWTHRQHLPVGTRALVVGAEHVSYSAVLTLRDAGVRPVALVTDLPRAQTFRAFDLVTRLGLRVPVWTGTSVVGIDGRHRVARVRLRGPDGSERGVAVDTVVFSGDFIPDNELSRLAGLPLDGGTRGPLSAADGSTGTPGMFVAGNLVHPAETADVVAQRATAVGRAAADWLRRRSDPGAGEPDRRVRVRVTDPLLWVVPNLLTPMRRPGEPVLLRTRAFLGHARLEVRQGERVLATYRLRRVIPNRSHAIPSGWCLEVRSGEDVGISAAALTR